MSIKQFEDLEIWQLARKLTNKVYSINFGKDFGLANQICRAAVSIMSNIAEGFERDGNREFIQFLYIAKASCGEVRSQLYITHDQGHIDPQQMKECIELAKAISMRTAGLIKRLRDSGMKGIKYKTTDKETLYHQELQKIFNEVIKR